MNKLCVTVDEAAELASVAPAVIRQWADAWLAKRCQARIGE